VHTVEEQQLNGRLALTPMEIGFFRVVNGRPLLTYGAYDEERRVQVKMQDLTTPGTPAPFVTNEEHSHVDPYGFVDPTGALYLVAGIDAEALMHVYEYDSASGMFEKKSEIRPPSDTMLDSPSMATSFEPIFKGGQVYGAYQINDGDPSVRGYIATAFEQPGEIWLVNLSDPSGPQIMLNDDTRMIRTEPEPLAGRDRTWMFYNAAEPGEDIRRATWHLRRSVVPLD